MNNRYHDINDALPKLMNQVMAEGEIVQSRVGATRELRHQHIVLENPLNREVVLPKRKASLVAQIAETMWVLSGRNDVDWLSNYLPRARDFSDDGVFWRGGYGPRIRMWEGYSTFEPYQIDQLRHVVELLKAEPDTRRAVISIYNPKVDTFPGKDIPCNDLLVFSARNGVLDLSVHIRSNDLMWGWSGINAFEWSVLLEVVAGLTSLRVGELHFHTVSLHLYDRHWARAEEIGHSPVLVANHELSVRFDPDAVSRDMNVFDAAVAAWFRIEESIRRGHFSRQDIDEFPEPMLRSWLGVIAWKWTGDESFLGRLDSPTARAALLFKPVVELAIDPFSHYVAELHREKHRVYGDSWKKRGEQVSIQANIARKIDRLGVAGAGDTAADTVIDLLVYLIKYRLWLSDNGAPRYFLLGTERYSEGLLLSDQVAPVTTALDKLAEAKWFDLELKNLDGALRALEEAFEELATMPPLDDRAMVVDSMVPVAYAAARHLWLLEQDRQQERDARLDHQNPYRNVPDGE